jgi:exonuclease III
MKTNSKRRKDLRLAT